MSQNNSKDPLQELGSSLVSNIPNDVTVMKILTKLPHTGLSLMMSINHDWQRAIQGRMVYNERVCSNSTEKVFVVLRHTFAGRGVGGIPTWSTISLYSPSKNSWYKLPPIPGFRMGIPSDCQCISLDGSIYVLGGSKDRFDTIGITDVYVLDVAGRESHWKKIASMHKPRTWKFGSRVKDGKVFVFGGVSDGTLIYECEVYDPKVDAWSVIKRMISLGWSTSNVAELGRDLLVYGSRRFNDHASVTCTAICGSRVIAHNRHHGAQGHFGYIGSWEDMEINETSDSEAQDQLDNLNGTISNQITNLDANVNHMRVWSEITDARYVEAYDHVKDEWRVVERTDFASLVTLPLKEPRHFLRVTPDVTADVWSMDL